MKKELNFDRMRWCIGHYGSFTKKSFMDHIIKKELDNGYLVAHIKYDVYEYPDILPPLNRVHRAHYSACFVGKENAHSLYKKHKKLLNDKTRIKISDYPTSLPKS